MKCKNCNGEIVGKGVSKGKFCCQKCKWTWHNNNRTLKPNVCYICIVCGKKVEKYVHPSHLNNRTFQFCDRTCKGKYMSGERHPMWNGGKSFDGNGYIVVLDNNHPNKTSRGYVPEHRLIMEQKIGRYLTKEEVVHHENDDITDNRISNLRLFKNQADHMAYHSEETMIRDIETGQFSKINKKG